MGIGFFGSPYVYNFLPDSVFLQIMVETGVVGMLAIGVFMVRSWIFSNMAGEMVYGRELGVGFKGAFIAMMVMGLAANTFYVFDLFGVFLVLAAVSRHVHRHSGQTRGYAELARTA
jgi:hypothetical protein